MNPRKSSPKPGPKKRLFILDDHPMLREGLAQLINNEPDLQICGQAGTSREALDLVTSLEPDLVLARCLTGK